MSMQLGKWEDYSNANSNCSPNGRTNASRRVAINRAQLLKTISSTIQPSKPSLEGGLNQRIDRQLKEFASMEKFLYDTLRRNLNVYNGEAFVLLKRLGSAAEENRTPPILAQRVKVGKGGTYRLIVRPDSYYEVWMLEPTTLLMGSTTFVSPRNGGNREVPPVVLCHDDKGDTDLDYLTDRSERIVGTSFDQSDTDGDSVADGFEVLMGSDPTGGNAVSPVFLPPFVPPAEHFQIL